MTTKKAKRTAPQERSGTAAGLIDAVIEISKQQAKTVEAMKAALENGDDEEALERARELTGLPSKRRPN